MAPFFSLIMGSRRVKVARHLSRPSDASAREGQSIAFATSTDVVCHFVLQCTIIDKYRLCACLWRIRYSICRFPLPRDATGKRRPTETRPKRETLIDISRLKTPYSKVWDWGDSRSPLPLELPCRRYQCHTPTYSSTDMVASARTVSSTEDGPSH